MNTRHGAADGLPFRRSGAVLFLVVAIVALALVATLVGLLWQGGEAPSTFTALRGQTVRMFGQGTYRYDTLFGGSGNRGTDVATLFLGIPLLVVTTFLYWRGSLRGALLQTGAIAYLLYVYATLSLNAAYNELFLVYVALFSASLFAFVTSLTAFDLQALGRRFSASMPRRGPAIYMLAAGSLTALVWLMPVLTGLLAGEPPKYLDSYTTPVTYALDLAVIVPAVIYVGTLLRRGRTLGYLLAFPPLVLIVMLFPAISLQTAFQLAAGITFAPPEIVGPIVGFLVAGAAAVWVLGCILRNVAD